MEIDRESALTKRQGMFSQVHYMMDLMEINYLLHHRLLIRFSYVQKLNLLTTITTFVINIIITYTFVYKLKKPSNYNEDFT